MQAGTSRSELQFPFPQAPELGTVTEVAEGILWARLPLPFRLDHVNVYLIREGAGWAVFDTGIADDHARLAWERLFAGHLAGLEITRVIVTHFHPDHIGLAGYLCERFGVRLITSLSTFLQAENLVLNPGAPEQTVYRDIYRRHGMTEEVSRLVSTRGHEYLGMITPLPSTFERLVAGDQLVIGSRSFDVRSGDGHAPEQLMLFCGQDKVLLAADQVLAKITPNISVAENEPSGDPLGLYLRSLDKLASELPLDTLVLPGHQLPFYGLQTRCRELIDHHLERCSRLEEACREATRSVAELIPFLFSRPLDPHQLSFAFSETHAHVNYLIRRGVLEWEGDKDGSMRATIGQ